MDHNSINKIRTQKSAQVNAKMHQKRRADSMKLLFKLVAPTQNKDFIYNLAVLQILNRFRHAHRGTAEGNQARLVCEQISGGSQIRPIEQVRIMLLPLLTDEGMEQVRKDKHKKSWKKRNQNQGQHPNSIGPLTEEDTAMEGFVWIEDEVTNELQNLKF